MLSRTIVIALGLIFSIQIESAEVGLNCVAGGVGTGIFPEHRDLARKTGDDGDRQSDAPFNGSNACPQCSYA
jgi:hypothetical protein